MTHLTHPLILPESIEEREYQLSIAATALLGNTMVVLPTGLGKTAIGLIVAASRIKNYGGKLLMMAPTKPLVEQHFRFFSRHLLEPPSPTDDFEGAAMFTGETPTAKRMETWKKSRYIFATPQVIKNDVLAGRYGFSDVSLLIIDECHRAVGNYAYVFIAGEYNRTASHPLVLAMTASPGSNEEKISEICVHMGIESVESRTETDPDVKPYIHERELTYVSVDLPPELGFAVRALESMVASRLQTLGGLGFRVPSADKLTMKAIQGIQAQSQSRIKKKDSSGYIAASILAECMKLRHATALAEGQGSEALKGYLHKLAREGETPSASKASKRLAGDAVLLDLLARADAWETELHPKQTMVRELVQRQLELFPDSRIIVFATFRDTVQILVSHLQEHDIDAERFVGQASRDTERGLSQKEQLKTMDRFRSGEFRVLVATSVGEEGLDVPSTDLVIFYEAVPSEIRSIQRKGRTGRHGAGSIIVLVTKGTSDEAYRWVSQSKEKSMHKEISSLRQHPGTFSPAQKSGEEEQPAPAHGREQMSIDAFLDTSRPSVVADDRETSSRVVECLHGKGLSIAVQRLEDGDYAIGDQILVERKTTKDFADSLIERDLLGQIRRLSMRVSRPILIIEGEDLFSQRNISPNAIRGVLAAIGIDMGVTILYTATPEETAEMLYIIARRLETGSTPPSLHSKKPYHSDREQQEYILASFPGIGARHARLLLGHFGTLRDVLNADEEALMQVEGVGKKTAETIASLMARPYTR
ncbi:Hef nuclease [Methanomicrobiaceae archaeon CYW5]|uniref:DEAD/DEAH box helicase n=1 Tax=Methanovulcanius yangii TaxID=1789227 RepID=UPI0029C9D5A5|nr:DEAD/DEAH box helicase [Methanovulcanius yangii]MBT8507447.1 Hef nuclease [Methanovulcanius yangii]